MSTPLDTRPMVDDADVISALIPNSPAALLAPPVETSPQTLPVRQKKAPPEVVYILVPAPDPFEEKERFWDTDWFCLGLVAMKWSAILGMVGIVCAYVVYPIVSLITTVVTVFGEMAVGIAALIVVGVVAYWATSLLGFWDHTKPSSSGLPSPVVTPVVATRRVKSPKKAKPVRHSAELAGVPLVESIKAKQPYVRWRTKAPVSVDDGLTEKWIARLRSSNQAYGGSGAPLGADCGVGHLLALTGDDGQQMVKRYGMGTLTKVARMNDGRQSLSKISKYLGKNVR